MHELAKRGMAFAVTTGGLLLAGAGYASAEQATVGGAATAHGLRQDDAGRSASATAQLSGTRAVAGVGGARATVGTGGILSGNDIQIPATVGVNACGNSVTALGTSSTGASCAITTPGVATTSGSAPGVLSGNALQLPITLPINLCGNSVLVGGLAASAGGTSCTIGPAAGTTTSSSVENSASATSSSAAASTNASVNDTTATQSGLGSGNAVQLPIGAPVNTCGTAVTTIGVQSAAAATATSCQSELPGATAPSTSDQVPQSADTSSTQIAAPSAVPGTVDDTQKTDVTPTALTPDAKKSGTTADAALPPDVAPPAIIVPPADAAAPAVTAPSAEGATVPAAAPDAGPAAPAQIAPQPVAVPAVTAHPAVVWPRPAAPQHSTGTKPLTCTPQLGLSAQTKALGGGEGSQLNGLGLAATGFASGTGLRLLRHKRRR
jgi:hypothetical protein